MKCFFKDMDDNHVNKPIRTSLFNKLKRQIQGDNLDLSVTLSKNKKQNKKKTQTIPKEKKAKIKKITTKEPKKTKQYTKKQVIKTIIPQIQKRRTIIRAPRSGWITFLMNEMDNRNLPLNPLTQLVAPIWANMTPEEREPYNQLYREDLARYKEELKNLSPTEKQIMRKQRKLKRNSKKIFGKKPLTAFMFFMQKNRTCVLEEHPGSTVPEVAQILGKKWKQMAEEEKSIYHNLASSAKKEYHKRIEMKEL